MRPRAAGHLQERLLLGPLSPQPLGSGEVAGVGSLTQGAGQSPSKTKSRRGELVKGVQTALDILRDQEGQDQL